MDCLSAPQPSYPRRRTSGFSLMELLIAVVLIAILASLAIATFSNTRVATTSTKLQTDTVRLNHIISLYLASGGSLDGLTSPEAIIEKLKTTRSDADSKRQVGVLTGRGIDIRLTPRMATPQEKASSTPRAVWNNSTKRFEISTTSGVDGVADFVLNDALLSVNFPLENRTQTAMLYNSGTGWVWQGETNRNFTFLSPGTIDPTTTENVFDPTVAPPAGTTSSSTTSSSTTSSSTTSGSTTSGSTTSGSTTSSSTGTIVTTLPKPINTPNGATFTAANFPTTVSINSNGAPVLGSQLKYRINGGSWIVYSTPFTIKSGDKVESKNFTILPLLYADSATDSDTYFQLVSTFAGQTTPIWINGAGGPNLTDTYTNANPDAITYSHGDTRLDLGGGEFLDAGVENTMTFRRNAFSGVPPNTDFNLGEMIILNGTTFNDSEATSVTLRLPISLTQPATQNGTVNVNFTMVSTPNTSDRLASADTVTMSNPTTSFTVTSGGVTYTLQLRFVNLDPDNGTVSGNTFYIYEGASARASIVGKFVSNK